MPPKILNLEFSSIEINLLLLKWPDLVSGLPAQTALGEIHHENEAAHHFVRQREESYSQQLAVRCDIRDERK